MFVVFTLLSFGLSAGALLVRSREEPLDDFSSLRNSFGGEWWRFSRCLLLLSFVDDSLSFLSDRLGLLGSFSVFRLCDAATSLLRESFWSDRDLCSRSREEVLRAEFDVDSWLFDFSLSRWDDDAFDLLLSSLCRTSTRSWWLLSDRAEELLSRDVVADGGLLTWVAAILSSRLAVAWRVFFSGAGCDSEVNRLGSASTLESFCFSSRFDRTGRFLS